MDVWKLDDHRSPEGWAEGLAALGAHVAQTTSLPVFLVGSTRRAADMYRALHVCVFCGAVLIGDGSPPVLPGPEDPSLWKNTKPVFFILGETDMDSWPEVAKAAAAAAAGPVELHTLPDDLAGSVAVASRGLQRHSPGVVPAPAQ